MNSDQRIPAELLFEVTCHFLYHFRPMSQIYILHLILYLNHHQHFPCSGSHFTNHILHWRPPGSCHSIDWHHKELCAQCRDSPYNVDGILRCCRLLYFWLRRRHWWQGELGNTQHSYADSLYFCHREFINVCHYISNIKIAFTFSKVCTALKNPFN